MTQDLDKRTSELEKHVAVIASTTQRMSDTLDIFIREARVHAGDMRDRVTRLETRGEEQTKQIETLFQYSREISNDIIPAIEEEVQKTRNAHTVRFQEIAEGLNKKIDPIIEQHTMERGGLKMLKDLRVLVPVMFTVVIGIVQLLTHFKVIKP